VKNFWTRAVRLAVPIAGWLGLMLAVLSGLPAGLALATPGEGSLLTYIGRRSDLSPEKRARWARSIIKAFGDQARLGLDSSRRDLTTARSVLSLGLFMNLSVDRCVPQALAAFRDVQEHVPPPVAEQYHFLALRGHKPKGRPIDLALKFPEHYVDAIAPDLAAYWAEALRSGTLPDRLRLDSERALAKTRFLMRPLLREKLEVLAGLARERPGAKVGRQQTIDLDIEQVESELRRGFVRVAPRDSILDPTQAPFDRLLILLEDLGEQPDALVRSLDPDAGEVAPWHPPDPVARPSPLPDASGMVLEEPSNPEGPLPRLPDQPRPGASKPIFDPVPGRTTTELDADYRTVLVQNAKKWLGTPFREGNATQGVSSDSAGLVRKLYQEIFGLRLPKAVEHQARWGVPVNRRSLRAGDLVFFDARDSRRIDHVGIVIRPGRILHASPLSGVRYSPFGRGASLYAFRQARRVLAYPVRSDLSGHHSR
jgi:hypothetical protein